MLKFFDADPDPGWKSRIQDKYSVSATLTGYNKFNDVTNIYEYQPCRRKQPSS
jgi:hypothetical protein